MDKPLPLGSRGAVAVAAVLVLLAGCPLILAPPLPPPPPEGEFIRSLPQSQWDSAFAALPLDEQMVVFRYAGLHFHHVPWSFQALLVENGAAAGPYLIAEIEGFAGPLAGIARSDRRQYSITRARYLSIILGTVGHMRCDLEVEFDEAALAGALNTASQVEFPTEWRDLASYHISRASGDCDVAPPPIRR